MAFNFQDDSASISREYGRWENPSELSAQTPLSELEYAWGDMAKVMAIDAVHEHPELQESQSAGFEIKLSPTLRRPEPTKLLQFFVSQPVAISKPVCGSEQTSVEDVINAIRKLRHHAWIDLVTERLQALFNAAREEEPDGPGIDILSLRRFFDFLAAHPTLQHPSIVISPSGCVMATWYGKEGRLFVVEFLPSGQGRFAIFLPDRRHANEPMRLSGSVMWDALVEKAHAVGVDWGF